MSTELALNIGDLTKVYKHSFWPSKRYKEFHLPKSKNFQISHLLLNTFLKQVTSYILTHNVIHKNEDLLQYQTLEPFNV